MLRFHEGEGAFTTEVAFYACESPTESSFFLRRVVFFLAFFFGLGFDWVNEGSFPMTLSIVSA